MTLGSLVFARSPDLLALSFLSFFHAGRDVRTRSVGVEGDPLLGRLPRQQSGGEQEPPPPDPLLRLRDARGCSRGREGEAVRQGPAALSGQDLLQGQPGWFSLSRSLAPSVVGWFVLSAHVRKRGAREKVSPSASVHLSGYYLCLALPSFCSDTVSTWN